jgi:hypothetical protein
MQLAKRSRRQNEPDGTATMQKRRLSPDTNSHNASQINKWCADPEVASLLTQENCAKWAETADHLTGVAEDPDEDAILEMLGDMFELG